MLWVYVLFLTAGVVLVVPALVRSLDGAVEPPLPTAAGFAALVAGVTGLIIDRFDVGGFITFIAALALGLAAAAIHPEILAPLRDRSGADAAPDKSTEQAAAS